MAMRWFQIRDTELKETIQGLVDIKNKINSRKEYLKHKAALRGNKFINEEGKVIIMNRNFN